MMRTPRSKRSTGLRRLALGWPVLSGLMFLAGLVLPSCEPERPAEESGAVTVRFRAVESIAVKTALWSSDNWQHVTEVLLYVFQGTGADARCVAVEDVDWRQPIGDGASQVYRLKAKLTQGIDYTLLAVGLDCEEDQDGNVLAATGSALTYGFPGCIQAGNGLSSGTTLAEAKARLAGDDYSRMAVSELFAGWNTIRLKENFNTDVTITMERRVAGVLAYFTNIPEDVASINVFLHKNQYKDVPLQKASSYDHGSEVCSNSETLMRIPVTPEDMALEQVDFGPMGEPITKLPGSLLRGAYMLPLDSVAGTVSIRVGLYDAGGSLIKEYTVKTAGGQNDFPILANHFYSLGLKKQEEGTDEPVDLGTQDDEMVIWVHGDWQADVDIPL